MTVVLKFERGEGEAKDLLRNHEKYSLLMIFFYSFLAGEKSIYIFAPALLL
jgi:hypothetical protein